VSFSITFAMSLLHISFIQTAQGIIREKTSTKESLSELTTICLVSSISTSLAGCDIAHLYPLDFGLSSPPISFMALLRGWKELV
jgi:hypothetical protein